eukprot:GHVQ01038198.1.p1 GENE.GHVQ01038198.1~~GHVQ01038198.1.p1  ORF type:complete len:136 (-),score=1.63 GHVQ01038198.1:84-491(-)
MPAASAGCTLTLRSRTCFLRNCHFLDTLWDVTDSAHNHREYRHFKPRTKRELRSFLCAASFVRAFVPNFSELVHPFRNLSDRVMLNGPKGEGPFVLVTDASQYAVGAACLQYQDKCLVPMGFYSKSLSIMPRCSG